MRFQNCAVTIDCLCEHRYNFEAECIEDAEKIAESYLQKFLLPEGRPSFEMPTGDLMAYDCKLDMVAYDDLPENAFEKTKKYVAIYTAHCDATYYLFANSKKDGLKQVIDMLYEKDKISIDSGNFEIRGINFENVVFYPPED